jgi:hypothetical protein
MCRAAARAIFSPKYRATTLSAISMPAEMPADVTNLKFIAEYHGIAKNAAIQLSCKKV